MGPSGVNSGETKPVLLPEKPPASAGGVITKRPGDGQITKSPRAVTAAGDMTQQEVSS